MRTCIWVLFGVVAISVTAGGSVLAADQPKPTTRDGDQPKKDGEKGDGKRIVGTLAEVNETAKAINVVRKADGGETKTLIAFTADTKVFVNGKEARLADIPRNALAEVLFKLNPDPKGLPTATEIRIAGKDRRLLLDKIDGKQLFYQTEGASRTLALADGVTVVIVGKDAKLADLKHGDAISATMSTDNETILKIVVKKRQEGGDREKDK